MDELQALYNSEINFEINCFYDDGFNWGLGDFLNGWKAQGKSPTLKQAITDLFEAVVKTYPDSDWVKRHQS